jgi:hypothetical protein
VKWAKNAAAWTEMVSLFLDPPSLFHHLHGLDWYRGALLASLPCTPSDLAGKSFLEIGCAAGDLCTDVAAMGAHVCGLEHPFRVLKCQFGFNKVRYRGLVKNTAQLTTLFALSNLWMARGTLLQGTKA